MADAETVHVKLGLSGTFWDKRPEYRISFNEDVIKQATVSADRDVVEYIEFDIEYASDTATIKIEFLNKEPEDTKKDNYEDPDNYKIIDDMLLNIVSVEVDEIDLGILPLTHGKYTTLEPVWIDGAQTTEVSRCTNLGWKGSWTLTWTNPFYLWLLETL